MKKHKKKFYFLILSIALPVLVSSCYPGSGAATSDYDLVATFYNKDADFSSYKTYVMPDSIVHITGDSTQTDSDLLTRNYDKLILNTIRTNIEARGYTVETDPENNPPDIVVLVMANAVKNYSYSSWYPWYGGGYWGWWPGWGYYPGWGGGYYPGYPPGGTISSYTVGTLFIFAADVEHLDNDNKTFPVIWTASLNGILNSGNTASRLTGGINQAFNQSPYFVTK